MARTRWLWIGRPARSGSKPATGLAVASAVVDPRAERLTDAAKGVHCGRMNELLVGYARVSTEQQDLAAQRDGLRALGVSDNRIYVDHGLTGTNRDRPGLRLALAGCRSGDTFVVTKLDRLARSLPDAREILGELTKQTVKLSLVGVDSGPDGDLLGQPRTSECQGQELGTDSLL